ncbi:MAG TPA: ABC transporter permease [Solirubrobacteraceae bacterium]|jgi:ABC-2 type transport system permease protein/oleandomycin transport system permease protein|nr:ABC transporter permease [Solirubrobacteraceae bacterium]
MSTRQRTYWALSDAWVVTKYNLIAVPRVPELLVFLTIQPILFIVLFRYVFGGAINTPGLSYVDFLIPGIIVQTVAFGGITTGVGLAEDLQKGVIDRLRSLPMTRYAVLAGRTVADIARNLFSVVLMVLVGIVVGFSFHDTDVAKVVAGVALIVLFGFAFSWIAALIGLSVPNAEVAQSAGFIWLFPLTFASSAFVPVASMPDWLQAFAKVQPVTVTVNALRELWLGVASGNDILWSVVWSLGLIAIFAPLATLRYRRTSRA